MRRHWRWSGRRQRRALPLLVVLVVAVFLFLRRHGSLDLPHGAKLPPLTSSVEGRVARVKDGDSVVLDSGEEVRYLGIDAPEEGEPLAEEAREENRRLVAGRRIALVRAGADERDRYGRLLALVYLSDEGGQPSTSVQVEILRQGLAWVYLTGPGTISEATLEDLLSAQALAMAQRRGVWSIWLDKAPRAGLVSTRFRIHRRGCKSLEGHRARSVRSLEEELRQGKSPCRECRPMR